MQKKRVIFGAIDTYKSVTKYFVEKYEIAYIVDNDKSKQGTDFYGVKIHPVEKLLEEKKEELHILVAVRSAQKEIIAQLEALGFEKDKHFFFFYEAYERNTFFDYLYWRNVKKTEDGKYIPTCLHVELSGICNLQCAYCSFHGFLNRKEGYKKLITWDVWREIVAQAKSVKTLESVNACGAGEIFMHPEWFELLQHLAKETNIPKLVLYTNGMLLTKENAEKINRLDFKEIALEISVSGKTEEENDSFRKGSSYKVIKKNLEKALAIFDTQKVHVVITNNYVLDRELIEKENYSVLDSIEPAAFLERDFSSVPKCAHATYVSPNEEGNFPKSDCFEYVKVSQPCGTHCIDLFTTIVVDCEGNYLKCSSGEYKISFYGSILQKHMLDIFQTNPQLNIDREKRLTFQDPEFCLHCNGSVEGYYIPVKKTEKIVF